LRNNNLLDALIDAHQYRQREPLHDIGHRHISIIYSDPYDQSSVPQ